MIINTNIKERLKTGALLLSQSYKIIMGTLTSVFVPQKCNINGTDTLCSITHNIENDDNIHRTTFIFNVITALFFLGLYYVEMKRETWLIKHFDIDHDKPDTHLETIIINEDEFKKLNYEYSSKNDYEKEHIKEITYKLIKYNKIYFYSSIVTTSVFVANNIASINIISNNNYGSATLNAYISFLMLIMIKLYNAISVSYRSKRDTNALSAYLIEFSSFNTLDQRHINNNNNI